jgi:hypothetical protein
MGVRAADEGCAGKRIYDQEQSQDRQFGESSTEEPTRIKDHEFS